MEPVFLVTLFIRIIVRDGTVWNERVKAFKKIGENILTELSLNTPVQFSDLSGDDINEAAMRIVGLKKEKALDHLRSVLPKVLKGWKDPNVIIEEIEVSFDLDGKEIDVVIKDSPRPA